MTPEPATEVFARLLEVQDHDTTVDQLRHRRITLPERAEIAEINRRVTALGLRQTELTGERSELGMAQARLADQIDASRRRKSDLDGRMSSGAIRAPRDLQAMDDEVRQLARHISDVEDRELEVMEAIEPLDTELVAIGRELRGLATRTQQLLVVAAAAETGIDAEVEVHLDARRSAAALVAPALLAQYEQLRTTLGGTGAARLVGSSCGGCHLALSAVELDQVRRASPDTVVTCEQCGRILVR